MRKKETGLPPALPRDEYVRLLGETSDAYRPLLATASRESAPRYRIIPQRECKWVLGEDGTKTSEFTGWVIWICNGRNLKTLAVVRSERDWEVIREAFSGEEVEENWWIGEENVG